MARKPTIADLREAAEAEVAEAERDPGLESSLDLPDLETTAVVVHGSKGSTADDIDGFHDALVDLLPLQEVIRTGIRSARVLDEDGSEVEITWTADDAPRDIARAAQRALLAAAPSTDDLADTHTESDTAQEQAADTRPDWTWEDEVEARQTFNRMAEDDVAGQQRARLEYERRLLQEQRAQQGHNVANGPGFRGRYGMLGDWNR